MIPFTFPSQPSVVSGNAECKVWYLSSVVGMARWIDYIPVRQIATASPIEGRTDAGGYQAVTLLSSISGLAAWTDYVPVYEDSSATVAWGTGADGYIPVGSAGAALSLQMLGSNTLDPRITFTRASSGTHFDSTGRLVTDGNNVARFDYDPATAAGVTGGELVTNGDFSNGTTGWSGGTGAAAASVAASAGGLVVSYSTSAFGCAATPITLVSGKRYQVTFSILSNPASAGMYAFVSTSLNGNVNRSLVFDCSDSPGTYTTTFTCLFDGANYLLIGAGGGGYDPGESFTIDNISVQEVTYTPRGLLIEEQRTNLLLHSRDMTQAAWSKTDVTAARTQVGIDGVASSACLMTEGSAGTASLREDPSVTAGSTITGSVILKRGSTDWVRIILADTTLTDGANAWFNLNTGAKGVLSVRGAATNLASTITSLGGGWYRCTVTCTPNGAYTIATVFLNTATADNSTTRVANATYIVDCAQLEVGAFATSPIITGAATATRAADSASMTGTNFSSWFNATAGTFVVEYGVASFTTTPAVLTLTDATLTTNGLNSNGAGTARWWNGATNVSSGTSNIAVNVSRKEAFAFTSSSRAITLNSGTLGEDANAPFSLTPDRVFIGSIASGSQKINGHIRSIRYYNTRLPNTQLTALTA